jgi:hypothetical protein
MGVESSGCGDAPQGFQPIPAGRANSRAWDAAFVGVGQAGSTPAPSLGSRSILSLAALLLLTACASDPVTITQRIYVKQEIPASLLTCAPWPAPDSPPQDVRGLVEWLAESKAAWMDCSYRLERVAGLVTGAAEADAREK